MEKKVEDTSLKAKIIYWKYKFRFFRNKYIFTITIFTIFALFLDDNDIFTLFSQNSKLNRIQTDQTIMKDKLRDVRHTLKQLSFGSELERFAREEKLFKKDNEDIFILSYE